MKLQDTVVHEVGHALAGVDVQPVEPVTGFSFSAANGGPGINVYVDNYAAAIRAAKKPMGPIQ